MADVVEVTPYSVLLQDADEDVRRVLHRCPACGQLLRELVCDGGVVGVRWSGSQTTHHIQIHKPEHFGLSPIALTDGGEG